MFANYHSHTTRCNHAVGTQREYVERAIEGGYRIFGFSDHTPYPFDGGYRSTFRMLPGELEGYVRETLDLKAEYKNDIDIRLGLEVEYYPRYFEALLKLCEDYPIEYFILGQHALNNEFDGVFPGRPTDDEEVLRKYCSQVTEALETGRFLYLAHPDMINYTGPAEIYEKHIRGLCSTLKRLRIPAEINFLGMFEHRHYPNPRFWKIAGEEGVETVFGADAHAPERVFRPECEEHAMAMVKEYGLRLIENALEK